MKKRMKKNLNGVKKMRERGLSDVHDECEEAAKESLLVPRLIAIGVIVLFGFLLYIIF